MRLKKTLPLILLLFFFIVLLYGVWNQSHSWYFQDETEHVTVGWMITDYGRQLYQNLSTNHQPLPIFLGAFLAKVIPYNNLFQLITGLRLSMWLLALIGSLMIVKRFGWQGLIATTLTYSLGHYFFAWHVLAESLVIPAIIWILLLFWQKNISKIDLLILGLANFCLVFNLVPLWPFVLLANLYFFATNQKSQWKWLVIGSIVPTLILFLFFNPFDWWRETIFNNLKYFIPFEKNDQSYKVLKIIFYPLFHLQFLQTQISIFYLTAVGLITYQLTKIGKNLNKKLILKSGFFALMIISLNLRIANINVVYYQGFHLFPYVAGTAVVIAMIFTSLTKEKRKLWPLIIIIATLLINNSNWIWQKRNRLTDYQIQYGTFQSFATGLQTIRHPGDKLMTGPDGVGYLNMMADLPLSGKQNFHLPWAYRVPYLRQEWTKMMEDQPPTFIYFDLKDVDYSVELRPILANNYHRIFRKDGRPTLLYIHKQAIPKITSEQWYQFETQFFLKPME